MFYSYCRCKIKPQGGDEGAKGKTLRYKGLLCRETEDAEELKREQEKVDRKMGKEGRGAGGIRIK